MDNPFAMPLLTTEQVEKICDAVFEVLERTGVKFPDKRILDSFAERGARVDFAQSRVRLPRLLMESLLKTVSPAFDLYARGSSRPVRIGRPEIHFSNSTYDMWVLDYETSERHRSSLAHVEKFVRLENALDNIDIVGGQVVPQDVPDPLQQIRVAETLLKHTSKPFVINLFNVREGATVLDMVAAVCGPGSLRERPHLLVLVCPDSPLRYETPVTDVMRLAAEHGVPLGIGPCPVLGMSAPITLAGTLTQALAEALAGLAFVKVVDENCPVYLGITPFAMAPQGNLLMAAPECFLIAWGFAQVCQHLKIPNSFSCTHTDSKLPTMQTGYEKAMGLMLGVLSGSPIVQIPAILDDGATTSLEQLVIESEMAAAAQRMLKGFDVCEETLALDVIEDCVARGNLVTHDHTVAHLRSEFWFPNVLSRGTLDQLQTTRQTITENAVCRVKELLTHHHPTPLPTEAEIAIEKIIARYERETNL